MSVRSWAGSGGSSPISSLQIQTIRWTEGYDNPNKARSADSRPPAGPIGGNTQIYEGTNQIQRVVIAKRLLG
jgi:hypothetical protein